MSVTGFHLSERDRDRLHSRALRRQQRDHGEVCGVLLLKSRAGRLELIFLDNTSRRSGRFELDTRAVKQIRTVARRLGKRVVGYFHSHPVSPAIPGNADIRRAPLRSYQLIYDVCGRELRLWYVTKRSGERVVIELPLSVQTKPGP